MRACVYMCMLKRACVCASVRAMHTCTCYASAQICVHVCTCNYCMHVFACMCTRMPLSRSVNSLDSQFSMLEEQVP
jgi:hypothetical protein